MTSTDSDTAPLRNRPHASSSRPSFKRSRSTCMMMRTAQNNNAGTHNDKSNNNSISRRRRPRADTIFTRRRSFMAASSQDLDSSSSISIDSLDLSIPLTRHFDRVRSLLEGSIEEALEKLECLQMELSSTDDDDSSDTGDAHSEGGQSAAVDFVQLSSPLPSSSYQNNKHTKQEDYETLQAFLDDVYELLSSIRKDLHDNLPSLPHLQFPTMPSLTITNPLMATFDKKAVYESLASNYEKAQEVLFHLSLYSPLSINLPEFPATLAASISSAAKGALAAASSTSTIPGDHNPPSATFNTGSTPQTAPLPSLSSEDDNTTPSDGISPSSLQNSSNSKLSLPQPPLSALRSFLISESKKLSSKLPSKPNLHFPQRPQALQDFQHTSSHLIATAINDASNLIHDETEKLKDFVHDETEKLKQALLYGKSRLLEFHELPKDWRNNKYILSGYRFIPADRPGELFLSAFKWHNETMNIYTHFIPAAYIIYYIFFIFPSTPLGDPTLNTFYDRSANLAFLLASLICLLLSAAWHLAAGCGTYSVFHSCATLDYLGISALISTSIISLTHAAFRCDPAIDLAYNLTTCIFGALGLYLPWKPWFNDREHKNVRIAFFVLLSAVGAAPIIHMGWSYGAKASWHFYSPVLYSLLAYKIGLLFYATDFPEALRPGGLFDTLAHSHQFWHCAIVVAIALHWQALKGMNEAGLNLYSCVDKDPYDVQYFMKWLHRRDEL